MAPSCVPPPPFSPLLPVGRPRGLPADASSRIASHFRQLWHELTSNDRHASVNSPYRSGGHVALPQNRHQPLTSAAASALDSRTDLDYSPYGEDLEAGHGVRSGSGAVSPPRPYSPGGRKPFQTHSSSSSAAAAIDAKMADVTQGEIQMQNFSDGLPPPPPVAHSWKRMDRWLEDNYEELWENIGDAATVNDVNELEHELDCTLPQDVRESLQIHDGQERGGQPTGIVFGCMLLDCEEIIQEWQNWRTVNEAYFGDPRSYEIPRAPLKAFASSSSSSAVPVAQPAPSSGNNLQWRQELQAKQDSQPPNAVRAVYAHPAWIPLARDWGGNNICVDLAPGPTGRWGQVILMGRDYDCKYVVSRSWAAFLATLADDMNTDKWFIDEDTKELKLREFRQQSVEPAYIDILRWRADQKYGRKAPKKRPLQVNSQATGGGGQPNGPSPYQSPTSAGGGEDRGRSPHRLTNGKQPATGSPRGHIGSPLARVAEEAPSSPSALHVDTAVEPLGGRADRLISADTPRVPSGPKFERLVAVDSPVIADESERRGSLPKSRLGAGEMTTSKSALSKASEDDDGDVDESEMKDVQI